MKEYYELRVKRQGKRTDCTVIFSTVAVRDKYGDLQGATLCVLRFPGGIIHSGVALLHPKERATEWEGRKISFDRALDSFVSAGLSQNKRPDLLSAYYSPESARKAIKTIFWGAFMDAVHEEERNQPQMEFPF